MGLAARRFMRVELPRLRDAQTGGARAFPPPVRYTHCQAPTMFFRQLEYLVTLARERHFARAAQRCHVSQPALSMAIRHLEEELGVTIVQRGRRFIGFTPEGERILAWARHSLAALSGLRQEASAAQGHLTGLLRVGAVPTAAGVMALLTGACREVHPDLSYSIQSLSSNEILRRVSEYDLDVGLMYLDDVDATGYRLLPLYDEHYMLLAAATAPEAGQAAVRWQDLAQLPLCLLTPNMQNRQIVNSAFRRESVIPYVVLETDSMSALLAHVRHAGLYSVAPRSLLEVSGPPPGLVMRPLEPEFTRSVGLIALAQEPPAPMPAMAMAIAASLDLASRLGV